MSNVITRPTRALEGALIVKADPFVTTMVKTLAKSPFGVIEALYARAEMLPAPSLLMMVPELSRAVGILGPFRK